MVKSALQDLPMLNSADIYLQDIFMYRIIIELHNEKICFILMLTTNEPRREKSNVLQMRKQRRRSASG